MSNFCIEILKQKGTIILMRIPIDVPADFKYEKYIQ